MDAGNQQDSSELGKLELVPHDPAWADVYVEESNQLRDTPHFLQVMHIGSTALPGISTKPVIDIAMLVNADPGNAEIRSELREKGYISRGEFGLPGREFFTKGDPAAFHLHVVNGSTSHWDDWRDFRDYLLEHKAWREAYQQEKLRIAEAVEWNRVEYTKGKSEFIRMILTKARER